MNFLIVPKEQRKEKENEKKENIKLFLYVICSSKKFVYDAAFEVLMHFLSRTFLLAPKYLPENLPFPDNFFFFVKMFRSETYNCTYRKQNKNGINIPEARWV